MKKKVIALISVIIIITSNVSVVYADSLGAAALSSAIFLGGSQSTMAAGGAVGGLAAASSILPWALAALGIAGVGYILSRPGVIEGCTNALKTAGNFVKTIPDKAGNAVDYVGIQIKNGTSYLSEEVLKIVAKYGLENGLFDGVTTKPSYGTISPDIEGNYIFSNSNTIGMQSLRDYAVSLFPQYYEQITKLCNSAGGYSGFLTIYGTESGQAELILTTLLDGEDFKLYRDYGDIKWLLGKYRGTTKKIDESGNVVTGNMNNISYYLPIGIGIGNILDEVTGNVIREGVIVSSLGIVSEEVTEGIPITDNIPKEEEEEIVLPNWISDSITIEGDTCFPVTLNPLYNIPVIYPITVENDVIVIPGIPFPPDIEDNEKVPDLPDNPSLPDVSAQEKAQEGVIIDVPVVEEFPGTTEESFKLPENIIDKFPFCIPFDLVSVGRKFVGSREAPIYTTTINLNGVLTEIEIDLSMYNGFASSFRGIVLIVFLCGLMIGTYRFIRI